MGFLPRSYAIEDPDHPGLLRAGHRTSAPYGGDTVEVHRCEATDGTLGGDLGPDLHSCGFDVVDLSGIEEIQSACARVREAGEVGEDDATAVRTALAGAELHLWSGSVLTVKYVSDEGFIMRSAGPNGLSVVGERSHGMNGHHVATSVHADQDVFGTPMVQLMDGRAPELVRHDSPEQINRDAGLMLVNLWIPLQQIVQPLALADGRSINRRRHQLRYGLATGSFLERDDEMVINDIWSFLHDDSQRWYLRSEMDHASAYVFDTLSTPHGAATLPGEDLAEHLYRTLEAAEAAVASGNPDALAQALDTDVPKPPPDVPAALREAIAAMERTLAEARAFEGDLAEVAAARSDGAEWLQRSRAARRQVVRMSLELRMVVSLGDT